MQSFLERKEGSETLKANRKSEPDIVNAADERSEEEDFTTELNKTDDDSSMGKLEDENIYGGIESFIGKHAVVGFIGELKKQ